MSQTASYTHDLAPISAPRDDAPLDKKEEAPPPQEEKSTATNGEGENNAIENAGILHELFDEQQKLQHQITLMEQAANDLDHDEDDLAKSEAEKLRLKASHANALATEISQVIVQVQTEPNKKVSRSKLAKIHKYVGGVVMESTQELGAAHAIHSESNEHEQEILAKSGAKKPTPAPEKIKKKTKEKKEKPKEEKHQPVQKKDTTHYKESYAHQEAHHDGFFHDLLSSTRETAHSVLHSITSTVSHIGHLIANSAPVTFAIKCGHKMIDIAVHLPQNIAHVSEVIYDGTVHLAEAAYVKTHHLLHNAKEMALDVVNTTGEFIGNSSKKLWNMMPWVDDDPPEKSGVAVIQITPANAIGLKAMQAVKAINFPGFGGYTEHDASALLSPPVTPMKAKDPVQLLFGS